ncbi:MAG: SusC/RagA family TonB-linked outer membrane protein [Bacteroidota bacterium]
MKLIYIFGISLIFSILPLSLNAQNTRVTLNMVAVPLNDVLNEIEKKSEYTFLLNQEFVDVKRTVTAVYTDTPISEILDDLFRGQNINVVTSGKQIVLTPISQDPAVKIQPRQITGKVTDAKNGEPLPGVTILVKGTTSGSITGIDGSYSIMVQSAADILVFSYLGYETREVSTAGNNVLNIQLSEVAIELESVVVTALGVRREEKALGYSVQKMEGEAIQTVKLADPTSTLTGKISGLMIKNSTNFGTDPVITLRGENPLIVVDGVPYYNISINDISPDDIKSIDVLKGPTASALYGYRGANGAIMVTTIRGNEQKGMKVSFNSSTMFNLGFIVTPKTQTSYSSGYNGKYADDYIWGDKLDIGRTATLWDPYEMVWKENTPLVSKGKDNLKNFQELGYVTNNNISIVNQTENGSIRSSISYINNKGQFPNQYLSKYNYSLGGEIKLDKLTLESNFSYSKHSSPNIRGSQYSGGYLYNIIGWVGAEWDIRDFTNYWLVKDESQNWFNMEWYDNPYFIANEVIKTMDRDVLNGFVTASYKVSSWMKVLLRTGLDSYIDRNVSRNPISARNAWSNLGYYSEEKYTGWSINNDLILSVDKTFGKFRVEGLFGGTIFYKKDDYFNAYTKGGLSIPGYYSLKASVDPIGWDTWIRPQQVNSLYSRISLSYGSIAYLDVTGRKDWPSTLNVSYFYPSVGSSLILSELLPEMNWLDLWKIRGSWTMSKKPAGVFEINNAYEVVNEVWSGYNSAYLPDVLKGSGYGPETAQTYEFGTSAHFFGNRANIDVTMYRKRMYDFLIEAPLSDATGYSSSYINSDEVWMNKGLEIMAGITPVKTDDLRWDLRFNWSKDVTVYSQLDSVYSEDQMWIKVGERVDAFTTTDWIRDPDGNLINRNGYPIRSNYESVVGYLNPDWIWGFNTSLTWKNLAFSLSVDGRMGGSSFSRLDALLWNSGAHYLTDTQYRYDEVVNGEKTYIGPGVKVISGTVTYDSYGNITSDTREYAPNDVAVSYESYIRSHYYMGAWSWCSQDILDETFLKLREVSVTYTVPRAISEKLKLDDLAISLVGQNLLYWGKEYKMTDPDYGQTWDLVSPSIRYAGVNIRFNF